MRAWKDQDEFDYRKKSLVTSIFEAFYYQGSGAFHKIIKLVVKKNPRNAICRLRLCWKLDEMQLLESEKSELV